MHGRRRSAGFSLIEVLVAVLIVSVGVLGVAGLQLVSLRNNTASMFRTQAFQASYEIIDRARANPEQDYSIAIDDPVPAFDDCTAQECTPAQMRTFDVATWLTQVQNDLPAGDAEIVFDAGTSTLTVTVRWQDDRNPAAGTLDVTVTTSL